MNSTWDHQKSAGVVNLRFAETWVSNLLREESDQNPHDSIYIRCVLLHASAPSELFSFYRRNTKGARGKASESQKFHRFVVLGVENSTDCLAVFTRTERESIDLFRYHAQLHPGCVVLLLNPELTGALKGTETYLFTTYEPLIAAPSTVNAIAVLPCYSPDKKDYQQFQILTNELRIWKVVPKENVCCGTLCDGSGEKAGSCICVGGGSRESYSIMFKMSVPELAQDKVEFYSPEVQSRRLISIFVKDELTFRPGSQTFDFYEFKDAVTAIVAEVNASSGWVIRGWTKPAVRDEQGEIMDSVKYNVTCIEPVRPLTDAQKDLRYGAEVCQPRQPTPPAATLPVLPAPGLNMAGNVRPARP